MKNVKWLRFLAISLLALTIQMLPVTTSFVSIAHAAQNQSALTSLEGSKWLANTYFHPAANIWGHYFYVFTERGKVKCQLVVNVFGPSPSQPLTDAINHETRLITDPGNLRNNYLISTDRHSEDGSYKLSGRAIHFEFPDHQIDALIEGDSMEGVVNWSISGKVGWTATKLSEESANSSASVVGNSPSPNVIRDENGNLYPASGYQWVNPNDPKDFRVKLMPGLIRTDDGKFQPAKGYRWINPNDPKDFRVEPIP